MTCIHRLEHVQSFTTTTFANNDTIRAHPQRIAHQFTDTYYSMTFHIGKLGFEANDMILLKLQFGGILNRNDPFRCRDETRQNIQERGLARPGPA